MEIWEEEVHCGNFPRELFGLSGVEQVRLITSGRVPLPPIHYLTGMRPTEVGVGSSTFVMPLTAWLLTPQGLMTAGEIAILADGPLGCAIQTVLPPATGYTVASSKTRAQRRPRSTSESPEEGSGGPGFRSQSAPAFQGYVPRGAVPPPQARGSYMACTRAIGGAVPRRTQVEESDQKAMALLQELQDVERRLRRLRDGLTRL